MDEIERKTRGGPRQGWKGLYRLPFRLGPIRSECVSASSSSVTMQCVPANDEDMRDISPPSEVQLSMICTKVLAEIFGHLHLGFMHVHGSAHSVARGVC